jgi:hypothetical protein
LINGIKTETESERHNRAVQQTTTEFESTFDNKINVENREAADERTEPFVHVTAREYLSEAQNNQETLSLSHSTLIKHSTV